MDQEEWDPRNDPAFWRRVGIAAIVLPSLALGIVFAPFTTLVMVVSYMVEVVINNFVDRRQIALEQASLDARRAARCRLLQAKVRDPRVRTTVWMRIVLAYYLLLTEPDTTPPA